MTYQEYIGNRTKHGSFNRYTRPAPQSIHNRTSSESLEYRRRAQAEAIRRREAEEAARRRRSIELRRRYEAEQRRMKALEENYKREQRAARAAALAEKKRARRAEEAAILRREIKVEKKKLSFSFVIIVLTAFVLLMGVIFSYAQIAESGAELSQIKSELSELAEEASELEVALENKNDVTLIEDLAVNELLMVREDSVQKKYVSTAGGDRIVLDSMEDESGENSGFFGSMLSSFTSAFDDILDYFR